MENLLTRINEEKESFENKSIQIVPGLLFNQKETIERIYFYYNSKFRSGDVDDEGDKKYFFNIVKNPCAVCTKSIDFDTKHIRFETADGGDQNVTWYMERDFKFWMRDKKFGKTLNRIFKELPIFGSVVLKEIEDRLEFVDLRNFIVEQSADSLDQANYIIEKHPYTVMDFKKVAKEMGWDETNVKEAIDTFREMKEAKHIMVYERYGEVEDDKGNWDYRRVYLADVGVSQEDQDNQSTIPYRGIELKSDIVDEHPYWEFHLEKIPGRWLGIGTVETLREPQIRENELTNLQSKASYWRAIVLFKSQDPSIAGKNLLTESVNGDIIDISSGDLNQVDISDKNLAFFNEETLKWLRNRDELSFSYDVIQGERLPAGTPLGSAQLAMASTISHFDQLQENIALDVIEMLYQTVIPNFLKENNEEHTLRIVGSDLDKFQRIEIAKETNRKIVNISSQGKTPSQNEIKLLEAITSERVMSEKERQHKIPKGFYKNAKYKLKIDITGESKDNRVWAQVMMAALQAITVDPTILTDPTKKKFFFWWLEANGVSPTDIDISEQKTLDNTVQELSARGGGGVSRPLEVQQPMAGVSAKTI